MKLQITRWDWAFLIICIGLGILAEISFLHGQIGVSYPIFISGFYIITFLRFRLSFNHRRIGLLLMVVIWVLSGNYLFYDVHFLHNINLFIIPVLVFIHIVLMTSPSTFKWGKPTFITLLLFKLKQGMNYIIGFAKEGFQHLFRRMPRKTAQTFQRVVIGLFIGVPLLVIITTLLMSADTVFQGIVLKFPKINFIDWGFRGVFILFASLVFFGIFQVLQKKTSLKEKSNRVIRWDHITAITILILINSVYILFVIIQFTYFFNDHLLTGFTYAEYARKGFFELILVSLINLTILISFLKCVSVGQKRSKLTLNILYSTLIGVSGVMLISAYQRLNLYETAYGFTLERILAHAFMIYLIVIFAYTFIRIWLEKLPLLHFYLIIGLIFYTGLNAVNLEKIIVIKNIDRFEATEKLDVQYLEHLSSGGVNGLIELYQQNSNVEDLEEVLMIRREMIKQQKKEMSWQSFNFTRQKAIKNLQKLEFQGE